MSRGRSLTNAERMAKYRKTHKPVYVCQSSLDALKECPTLLDRKTNTKLVQAAVQYYLERHSEALEYEFRRRKGGYSEDHLVYIPVPESHLREIKDHLNEFVGESGQEWVVGSVVRIIAAWVKDRRMGMFRPKKRDDDGLDGLEPIG